MPLSSKVAPPGRPTALSRLPHTLQVILAADVVVVVVEVSAAHVGRRSCRARRTITRRYALDCLPHPTARRRALVLLLPSRLRVAGRVAGASRRLVAVSTPAYLRTDVVLMCSGNFQGRCKKEFTFSKQ